MGRIVALLLFGSLALTMKNLGIASSNITISPLMGAVLDARNSPRAGRVVESEKSFLETHDSHKWWITKVDTTKASYPHLGARHPNGSLGMLVNPSIDRLLAFDPSTVARDVICPSSEAGIEGKGGHQVLQKIRSGITMSRDFLSSNSTRRSKVLCMVYTVHLPGQENLNLKAQASTWGRQCDGFIAASNTTDHLLGAIDLSHAGPECYENMWQKIRSMWAYAYDHYLDKYDFFHICGDDVYVVVDNLRAYVDGPEVAELENGYMDSIATRMMRKKEGKTQDLRRPRPLLFGSPMEHLIRSLPAHRRQVLFPEGGPGYTLNRAALKILGSVGLQNFETNKTDHREDVLIASCLDSEGVYITDTRERVTNGTRYGRSAEGISLLRVMNRPRPNAVRHFPSFDLQYKEGIDNPSSQFISFHLKDDRNALNRANRSIHESIYRYHTVLALDASIICTR